MTRKLPRTAILLALVISLLGAAAPLAAADGNDPKIPFERYKLDNGLEVILAQDNTLPLVAVDVWYHVGSGNEVVGKSGFAHLFEHMLFQGSKHVGVDRHFEVLQKVGGSGVNGTTNSDRTNYFEVVPSNQLETALWLESDRMGHMLPMLTNESFRNQVDVVRNERRQRYDNVPYGRTRLALHDAMFPEGHPYKYLTIGRHEDLEGASLDDVIGFFKTWYVPANATLTIVGDFEQDTAKQLVAKWFGSFPVSKKPSSPTVPAPSITSKRVEVKDEFAKLRQVMWAWHSPAYYAPGDAELDVAADALARSGTGRLYKLLVHEKQLAQSVSAFQGGATFSGTFVVSVTLRSDADQALVEQLVAAEIEKMRKEPLDQREIKRAVTAIESMTIWGLESLIARAEQLQQFNHFLGDPDRTSWDLDRYRKLDAEAIRSQFAKTTSPDRQVVVVTLPAGGAK